MASLIRENIGIIVTVVSLFAAGVTGYTTLRNDVSELQKNRVTPRQITALEKDVVEMKKTIDESQIKTVHTTVDDMSREIDTLYTKAELALKMVNDVRPALAELRGRYNASRSCVSK